MNFHTFKLLMLVFVVVVVGAFITALVDQALGLNQAFSDIGSVKVIIHKAIYMAQGGAIIAVVTWKDET